MVFPNIQDDGLLNLETKFFISENDYQKWISRIEVTNGDCIITNVGRSGVSARIPKDIKAALGRNMTAIRLRNDYPYPGFLITLLKSKSMAMEIEQNLDAGTILNSLNVRNIPKLKFILPSSEVLNNFDKNVGYMWDMMENNVTENYYLKLIRDTILPKLISGEIIPAALQTIEQTL